MKNRKCPKCEELGRDSQGDHLFLMEDQETWCCNKTEIHPMYIEGGGEPEDKMDVKGIVQLPIVADEDRCISLETATHFGVRTEFSPEDRSVRAKYYPETSGGLLGYKCRLMPKKFYSVHLEDAKGKVPDFFGQARCPQSGKRLLVAAGEEDAQAAREMLWNYNKSKGQDYPIAVVGVPRGEATSEATFSENLKFLKGFEEVLVVMDNDDAGAKALGKIAPIVGESLRVMNFSEKDLSDMLVKGKSKEFLSGYFNCQEHKPSNIVSAGDILEEAIERVYWGLSYPFEKLTQLTYGLKEEGEIIGLGASPGAGKSTLLRQIQTHLMFTHKQQVGIFDIEEGAKQGLKKMIGGIMNKPIHLPDCKYDMEEARRIGGTFDGLANFYDGDCESWDEVEEGIRYFASKGIRFFFVDPLSALVEHLTASEGNQELGRIMRSMRRLRKHQGLTFFHANHLNNPSGGKDHGEGAVVKASQFSGSRAQWKYSTLLLGLEGSQMSEDLEEKHSRVLRVLKDRLGGNTGTVKLHYNTATGILEQAKVEDY